MAEKSNNQDKIKIGFLSQLKNFISCGKNQSERIEKTADNEEAAAQPVSNTQETQIPKEYYCCSWINSGLHFQASRLGFCCYGDASIGGHPQILDEYSGGLITDDIISKIQKIKEDFARGEIFKCCRRCSFLEKLPWDGINDAYFDRFIFSNSHKCNSKCIYCFTNDLSEEVLNMTYNVYPVIKDLFDRGKIKISPKASIVFSGGEPTILPEFEQLLNLFLDHNTPNIKVHSSGIAFSKAVLRGLAQGSTEIIISPDAGCRETFLKVKRIDAFDKVMQNIKDYIKSAANPGQVKVKYIIIPKVNDTIEEIDMWLKHILDAGVTSAAADVEQHYFYDNKEEYAPEAYRLLDYFKKQAEEHNLKFEYYTSARRMIEEREQAAQQQK